MMRYSRNFIQNTNNFASVAFRLKSLKKAYKIKNKENFNKLNPISNVFLTTESKIYTKIFNIFFFLTQSIFTGNTTQSPFFKFFYFKEKHSTTNLTNIKKIVLRWESTSDLLFHLFWYATLPIFFSSPFFKKETLAFNWTAHHWEQNLWKYYFLFFNFKFNQNTEKLNFFCIKIQDLNINFFLVTDTVYHFKNLYYFRDFFFYTIGLVAFSTNPWVVHYPIPVADNHYILQLFFFKYVIFLKKNAIKKKYLFFKKTHLRLKKIS